jgi:hypothetical protein
MSDTRNGKIARLPRKIREQLNRRLQDGELGVRLVDWLNGLPEVQKILKDQFEERPVSGQNLSEWKQGGYQDWFRHQEASGFVQRLREEAEELKVDSEDVNYEEVDISEHLAVVLAAELGQTAFDLLKETDNPQERLRRLREVLHELGQLRRHNHRATRLKWDQRRWRRENEILDEKAEREEFEKQKNKILEPIWAKMKLGPMAEAFGGGEAGRKIASFILEAQGDLPMGTLTGNQQSDPASPNPTESDSIKPDQTGSNQIQPNPTKNSSNALPLEPSPPAMS